MEAVKNYILAIILSLFVCNKYEGFGLPILESYLYKCPVACTDYNSSLPSSWKWNNYFNADDGSDIY